MENEACFGALTTEYKIIENPETYSNPYMSFHLYTMICANMLRLQGIKRESYEEVRKLLEIEF